MVSVHVRVWMHAHETEQDRDRRFIQCNKDSCYYLTMENDLGETNIYIQYLHQRQRSWD